uniref:Uncharacterized protein n=1 Tax=Lactuca sativa TaxID=4236 RepID=A0A9R1X469_LACSA|nr:hypothetical protein LSAT_V11C700367820 [Lactuca sativa]
MKLFFLEADQEGKTMLEEASALGHLDSTFVLGMMLKAKGIHREHEALEMLNTAYRSTIATWNVEATCSKVHLHLNREERKQVHFHGFHRTCVMHKSVISVSDAFVNGYKWVFRCQICLWDACFVRMLNTRSCCSLNDIPIENLIQIIVIVGSESAKDIISTRLWSKKMHEAGGDPQVFRTTSLHIIEGIADEDHFEAIYLLGMIYISRGPPQCNQGLQLLDAYFGWAVLNNGDYTGVVDSAKELSWSVDVVQILTTKNITFQCEEANHSVKGEFVVGHKEDDDRQRYYMLCRWAFSSFLLAKVFEYS